MSHILSDVRMKSILLALAVTLALITSSCDVIEAPYLKNPIDPADTLLKDTSDVFVSTSDAKNVLLEDYTGHTCGNCPEAADVATLIVEKNPGRIVMLSVHVGPFATPELPDYPYDFQTTIGDTYDQLFRNSRAGLPNGLVNRMKFGGRLTLGQNNWEAATNAQLALSPALNMTLSHTYYDSSRTIVATVETEYLTPGEPDYSLVVLLTEDGVIEDQKDYRFTPSHREDYEFDHVLRVSMNGAWGDSLSNVAQPIGKKIKKIIRFTIPAGVDWKLENSDLVAFVYRREDDQTREVLQVVKQAFRP